MAQPTQQMPPQRGFSPPQHSPSPAATQPGFALPNQNVNKRPQLSFSPTTQSNPGSPYSASYPASPNPGTPTSVASPSYANLQPAPVHQVPSYAPPSYTNGHAAPNNSYTRPTYQSHQSHQGHQTHPNHQSHPSHPNHHPVGAAHTPIVSAPPTPAPGPGTPGGAPYSNLGFAPAGPQTPGAGAMGPPPAKDRPQRTYEYEVTDSLLGTGVDIREEEHALAEYYAGSFGQDSRTGFPANAPGNQASFYGAGPANQPGARATTGQKEFEAALAERRWNESAARLSAARAVEHSDPFLQFANLHARAEKVARQYNLDLNLDNKTQPLQKSRNPADFPEPKVTVSTKTGPDGALVSVYGSVLPNDSYLIDQLALLSIATKHRVRELIEDADKIATTRQQTSHGQIPADWLDSAVPLNGAGLPLNDNEALINGGVDNGASGSTNNRKRSFDASNASGRPGAPPTNHLAQVLREMGRAEREAEEQRLRKRQRRLNGDTPAPGSRSGSVAPGTPGGMAPEPEKAPTKKEQKKIAAQKHDASAESVNKTTMKFLGGGKKKYSWMSMGANTPSTPNRPTGSTAGTPVVTTATKAPESKSLTQEGRYKLGSWREYSEKGKNIQLRDWVTVLERDGREKLALQKAYLKLDDSEPR
ncbi:hypothetical protein VM1G_03251 [Cytospora mali]|uniref:Transcription initiation factor TFIID subunit 4 n=1 Tax=Cytospora mali TaxID=578113 RepID=A0A194VSS3_CYTMA|nr:hypothetical protein VM1G_03251 [Valsa mali]